ncbi:MAG TPA: amino acid permease, partial [Calditrichaeota bacterium]|nr:amino acid permease [Calditrichota bacterium]
AGRFQIALVIVLLLILGVFCAFGLREVNLDHFKGFIPSGGMKIVFATVGLIFVSFGGLTKVASIAEEVKNPGRNVPLGMISAYVVVCGLYIVAVFVTVGVLAADTLSGCMTPISLAAESIMGTPGLIILSVAAMIAFVTTANAGIMSASRSPLAMSVDKLLPPGVGRISNRRKTPTVSILLTSAFMVLVILFLNLEGLAKTASTMMILLFMSVNLSVIVMRESKIHSYRPVFRSPLYPWMQIAAIVIYSFLIFELCRILQVYMLFLPFLIMLFLHFRYFQQFHTVVYRDSMLLPTFQVYKLFWMLATMLTR